MWERGARHNPASLRYRFYMDHRPILPQDPTLGFWRKSYNQYEIIYFAFYTSLSKIKYLLSNNIPVKDREELKTLFEYDNHIRKNFKLISGVLSIFGSGFVFNNINFRQNYFYRFLVVFGLYNLFCISINKYYLSHYSDLITYYYYKYQHLTVDGLDEIVDNRRKFFQLDKSSYYRENSHDIRHASHHPANAGHHDHDTSTYYGPYPYDDHENLQVVEEINKKFTEGSCAFDNPNNELVLGEPIDIKRIVKTLPTAEDYRKL